MADKRDDAERSRRSGGRRRRGPNYERILEGTVEEVKERMGEMDLRKPDLEKLLETERGGKDRQTLEDHIEGLIEQEEEAARRLSPEDEEFEEERQERIDLAKEFTNELLDEYGKWIKSVIVWGSTARDEFSKKSDIDFVILVDDTKEKMSKNQRKKMDDEIYKMAKDMDERLSPQPAWTITEFVKMIRNFTPLSYELLKDGIPTYDEGFFLTHKRLLEMGEISSTPESAQRHWGRVPKHLSKAKNTKLWLVAEDLYYAMLRAQEAVMMYMGRDIPHPMHAPDYMRRYLVEPGMVDEKYADWLEDVIDFRKKVEHREIRDIDSAEIDQYMEKAEEFVDVMERLLFELEIQRKKQDVSRAYDVMVRSTLAALRAVDAVPEDPDDIPDAFHEELVEEELVSPFYEEVLEGVLFMYQKMRKREVEDISERYIARTTEYVRRFVGEVRGIYHEKGLDFEKDAEEHEDQELPDITAEVPEIEEALAHRSPEDQKAEQDQLMKNLETAGDRERESPDEDEDEIQEHEKVR